MDDLITKMADGSVIAIQGEKSPGYDGLLVGRTWDQRKYGRNLLAFFVKGDDEDAAGAVIPHEEEE